MFIYQQLIIFIHKLCFIQDDQPRNVERLRLSYG